KKVFNIAERIILIILIVATLILGVIFFIVITEFLIILNVAYALGLFTSVVIYMYVLIKA
ncbi:MAG: hypothetical protein ACFFD2_28135, partial [Promethearchaeota archaeon]